MSGFLVPLPVSGILSTVRFHFELAHPELADREFLNLESTDRSMLYLCPADTQRANRNRADGQGAEGRCTNGHCYKRSCRWRNDLQRCMPILAHQFILS
jgi:hypothetical protein